MSMGIEIEGAEDTTEAGDLVGCVRLDGGWRGPHKPGVEGFFEEGETGFVVDLSKLDPAIRVLRFRVTR